MRLTATAFDDAAVSRFWTILPELGLQLAAGDWFGESARTFRLGFGYLPMEKLASALGALRQAMNWTESAGHRGE